jgi:hypothetical protein
MKSHKKTEYLVLRTSILTYGCSFFMAVNLVIHKPNSNNSHIGTARASILNTSGGVMNIAIKEEHNDMFAMFF